MPRIYDMTNQIVQEAIAQYLPFLEIIRWERLDSGKTKDFVIKNNHYYFDISTTSFSSEVDPGWDLVDFDGKEIENNEANRKKYALGTWLKMDKTNGASYAKRIARWRENEKKAKSEDKLKKWNQIEEKHRQFI